MIIEADLVRIRQTPLFSGLKDDQLDCIRGGEIIEVPAGTVLVEANAPAEFFFLNLEGEIRISRRYDDQDILLGVNKPGMFMGEIPLLLDAPWHAIVRVSKPARLFRLDQENFWRMLGNCHSVAKELFARTRRKPASEPRRLFESAAETWFRWVRWQPAWRMN